MAGVIGAEVSPGAGFLRGPQLVWGPNHTSLLKKNIFFHNATNVQQAVTEIELKPLMQPNPALNGCSAAASASSQTTALLHTWEY